MNYRRFMSSLLRRSFIRDRTRRLFGEGIDQVSIYNRVRVLEYFETLWKLGLI